MNFDQLNTPIILKHSEDFSLQVSQKLETYLEFIIPILEKIKDRDIITNELFYISSDKISDSVKVLNSLYKSFDKGDGANCYELLRKLMAIYDGILNTSNFSYSILKNTQFFRIRPDLISDGKHIHNIFHIPFNLRHLISNLRFNPPGIPCLYCSIDLETASNEFNTQFKLYDAIDDSKITNKDALNVGLFTNSRELNCLDLSIRDFKKLYTNLVNDKRAFLSYSVLFPLIMLLHCKQDFSLGQTTTFRMEYMLPSFMMTWIYNQTGQGSKYFSGKSIEAFKYSSVKAKNPVAAKNFAFPASFSSTNRYCKVLESIFLSKFYYAYTDEIKSFMKGKQLVETSDFIDIESYIRNKIV